MFERRCYAAILMHEAQIGDDGVCYRAEDGSARLDWERVRRVFAADVGEPQGVRTIVFDLACEIAGAQSVVYRCDAEPGEAAQETARLIEQAVGPDRCSPAVRELAKDGTTGWWHPDLESFTEANLSRG